MPRKVSRVAKRVKTSKSKEYIFELRSNTIFWLVEWNKSPREKAPRMLDIVEPTIFPTARDDRFRATDAMTTTSFVE